MSSDILKPAFPWFGGKRKVAAEVWSRFGDVRAYSEPFAGSLAVLLARPGGASGFEIVNDLDHYIANFYRAVIADVEQVARYANSAPCELDLIAINRYLMKISPEFAALMREDPGAYDAKISGWWVRGVCCWIGDGFLQTENCNTKIPKVGGREADVEKILALKERLSRVVVACGDWSRVVKDSVTVNIGVPAAVFLDPPYPLARAMKYASEEKCACVSDDVREWAIKNGNDKRLRIALCGYEGEHDMPDGWTVYEWKANGGYANQGQGRGRENAKNERIWFSPHCLKPAETMLLF